MSKFYFYAFSDAETEEIYQKVANGSTLKRRGTRLIKSSLKDLPRDFDSAEALIFSMSTGIVIRKLAGLLRSKYSDPAVLVISKDCRYVIPLLSGHLGGANDLALDLASDLKAQAVITTASDLKGLTAPDLLIRRNGARAADDEAWRAAVYAVAAGKKLNLISDLPLGEAVPPEYVYYDLKKILASEGDLPSKFEPERSLFWSDRLLPAALRGIRIFPRACILGCGSKKGKDPADFKARCESLIAKNGIDLRGLAAVCTIDLKKNEKAIVDFASGNDLPLICYTPEELAAFDAGKGQKYNYKRSQFTRKVTGTPNVSAAAALLYASEKAESKDLAAEAPEIVDGLREEGMTAVLVKTKPKIKFGR